MATATALQNEGDAEVPSHSHIWHTTFTFINSMSLRCAIQLGIPDAIHRQAGRPITVAQLTEELSLPPSRAPFVGRLMRVLEHGGYFTKRATDKEEEEEDGGYVPTPASIYLQKHGAPFTMMILDPVMVLPWLNLSEWFRSDLPTPFQVAHGTSIWEVAKVRTDFNNHFNLGIAHDADLVCSEIVAKCSPIFEGVRSLVDVGGGNGRLARDIAIAFSHVSCTVLDLPHVVAGLPPSERLEYFAGNMFEHIPPADVVLLKHIIHDYNDEDSIKILKQCKKSINPSKEKEAGRVLIIDMVVNIVKDDNIKLLETQFLFDMEMMAVVGGKERDEKEWATLFTEVGFKSYNITPIADFLSVIEVFP